MERTAPSSVNYDPDAVLPLAIEGRARRRKFYASNGQSFSPASSNIIRIDVNADSMLDVRHSYIHMKIDHTFGVAAEQMYWDLGHPMIKRLRIESAGVILEDIQSYNELVGSILFPCQIPSQSMGGDKALTGVGWTLDTRFASPAVGALAITDVNVGYSSQVPSAFSVAAGYIADTAKIASGMANYVGNYSAQNQFYFLGNFADTENEGGASVAGAGVANSTTNCFKTGDSAYFSFPLVSGWLNMDKYIPLVLMNAGFTIEIELEDPMKIGAYNAVDAAATYSVSEITYDAHLIDLERSFYDRLKSVQQSSGGVLQLAGQTYRHYINQIPAASSGEYTLNIPARVKSIKSIFFKCLNTADKTDQTKFSISSSVHLNVEEYQFRVGSVVYPPTPVKCGFLQPAVNGTYNLGVCRSARAGVNRSECYVELQKALGYFGDSMNASMLTPSTYGVCAELLSAVNDNTTSNLTASNCVSFTPFGLDFETFPREALESGLDTASRSLQTTLTLKLRQVTVNNTDVDVFVVADALFYINADGTASVSV